MRRQRPDLLRIVEAAYDFDAVDADWLQGVAEAIRPHVDEGFGVATFEFRRFSGGPPQVVQRHHLGIPPDLEAIYPRVFETMDPEIRQRPFRMGPCVTGSQMMGMREEFRQQPHMIRFVQQFGMFDSLWVTAAEPSGFGCGVHAGRREVAWASSAEIRRWGRIAGHLSAAVRLRHRLRAVQPGDSPTLAEAILDGNGKVHEATGPAATAPARELLQRAVRTLEKARGPARWNEPDASLAEWKALVGGRWSLVDRLDSDGRRYILARENEPVTSGPPSLTVRETQVIGYAQLGHHNKLIAYELGIADSTVRVLLARASAKLGVHSRDELLRAVAKPDNVQDGAPTKKRM